MKKSILTKTLFFAMGLCAAGIVGTPLMFNNVPFVGVHAAAEVNVGDKFVYDGLNYEVTAVGETNTVKVGNNSSFAGTEVTIPATATYENVTFNVTEIGNYAFSFLSKISSVTFAENSVLKTIGEYAFGEINISEINIPASVETIGEHAFHDCEQLTSVTFEKNSVLKTIGGFSFSGIAITEINIPASVEIIKENAFSHCQQLITVTFEENSVLKTIEQSAFIDSGITEINIPSSVINISEYALNDCQKLKIVKMLATEVPTYGAGFLSYVCNLEQIYVPEDSVEAYKTATGWSAYADKIVGFHVHTLKTTHLKVESTCLEHGHEVYYECSCGKYFFDEDLTNEITDLQTWLAENGDGYLAPLGHNFGGQVTYIWNGDQCKASIGCQHDGCTETQTETANGVYVKDTDATTESNEKGHYEATFSIIDFVEQSTPANSVEIPNSKLPKEGISGGAIAGIAVGSFVGLCLIAYVVMFFIWKKTEKALKFLVPSYKWINKKIFKK